MNKNFTIEHITPMYLPDGSMPEPTLVDALIKIDELITTVLYSQARIDKLELQVEYLEEKETRRLESLRFIYDTTPSPTSNLDEVKDGQ